ncbi:hypothetical protein QBC46DRAFT_403372 [Diplogelasinospora grovesii]|uniref:Uncharacterized protein n=1 Tax=Diplogelasinospora grovesii TaxID=303347 RepID=A0AAN6NH18_9PEZI|nr:hypothetical protein QBC46DRAFT_403372 [Diplogelasinospora grovesii]
MATLQVAPSAPGAQVLIPNSELPVHHTSQLSALLFAWPEELYRLEFRASTILHRIVLEADCRGARGGGQVVVRFTDAGHLAARSGRFSLQTVQTWFQDHPSNPGSAGGQKRKSSGFVEKPTKRAKRGNDKADSQFADVPTKGKGITEEATRTLALDSDGTELENNNDKNKSKTPHLLYPFLYGHRRRCFTLRVDHERDAPSKQQELLPHSSAECPCCYGFMSLARATLRGGYPLQPQSTRTGASATRGRSSTPRFKSSCLTPNDLRAATWFADKPGVVRLELELSGSRAPSHVYLAPGTSRPKVVQELAAPRLERIARAWVDQIQAPGGLGVEVGEAYPSAHEGAREVHLRTRSSPSRSWTRKAIHLHQEGDGQSAQRTRARAGERQAPVAVKEVKHSHVFSRVHISGADWLGRDVGTWDSTNVERFQQDSNRRFQKVHIVSPTSSRTIAEVRVRLDVVVEDQPNQEGYTDTIRYALQIRFRASRPKREQPDPPSLDSTTSPLVSPGNLAIPE